LIWWWVFRAAVRDYETHQQGMVEEEVPVRFEVDL
jgi:hypothetical protein